MLAAWKKDEPLANREEVGNGRSRADIVSSTRHGNDTAYTLRRLARDHKEDRELHGLLVKHRPTGKTGPKPKENCVNNVNETPKRAMGNTRAYIEQRLQAEFPSIWKQYIRGEFKSARSAGIAAGFIKDTHDPVMRLKANWRKASRKQQNEFMRWLESEGGVEPKTKKASVK